MIWVVEIRGKQAWNPTKGMAFSRRDAYLERDRWHHNNPDDLFRVRKYVREEKR